MPSKGGLIHNFYQFTVTVKDVPEFITAGSWNPLCCLKFQQVCVHCLP